MKCCGIRIANFKIYKMEDCKYALDKLVNAIDEFIKQTNIHPLTEKTYKDLEKADLNLNIALSLAKEILNDME